MTEIGLHRGVAGFGTVWGADRGCRGTRPTDGKIKAPALRAAHVVGWIGVFLSTPSTAALLALHAFSQGFQRSDRRRCPFEPALRP